MALDPEFRRLLVSTVYVAPMLSVSLSGDVEYGTPVERKARIDTKHAIVHSSEGQELNSDIRMFCALPVGPQDRVWLPGVNPFENHKACRVPKSVAAIPDEDGSIHHYEVSL